MNREVLVGAVERYLASRGVSIGGGAAAVPAPAPAVASSTVASVAAEVVERFLARRGPVAPMPNPAPAQAECKPGGS